MNILLPIEIKVREFHSIDKKDERPFREDPYEKKKPSRTRKVSNSFFHLLNSSINILISNYISFF